MLFSEPHEVRVRDKYGEEHRLSRFWANWNTPRPESFTIVRFSYQVHADVVENSFESHELTFDRCLFISNDCYEFRGSG